MSNEICLWFLTIYASSQNKYGLMGEALRAVGLTCRVIDYRRFEGTCRLPLQGSRRIPGVAGLLIADVSKENSKSIRLLHSLSIINIHSVKISNIALRVPYCTLRETYHSCIKQQMDICEAVQLYISSISSTYTFRSRLCPSSGCSTV